MNDTSIVNALLDVARLEILKYYSPTSCVASTRIGIDALEYFGIASTAQPVEAMLFNHGGVKAFRENRAVMGKEWGIGLGMNPNGTEVGHVVILLEKAVSDVPAHISFIDLSLDQAARPQHKMYPEPSLFSGPVEWLTQEPAPWLEYIQPWGMITYRRSGFHGYQNSPNWHRKRSEREVTGKVIRAMKEWFQ